MAARAGDALAAVRVALCTAPPGEPAERIARALVEERLAACVNLVPGIRSVYRWRGEVHDDDEVLLVIKTSEPVVAALMRRLPELHPYEVPELLVLPVTAGLPAYCGWVVAEVERPAPGA